MAVWSFGRESKRGYAIARSCARASGVNGKRTPTTAQQLLHHVVVVMTGDDFSGIRLSNSPANRFSKIRSKKFLREELQEALRRVQFPNGRRSIKTCNSSRAVRIITLAIRTYTAASPAPARPPQRLVQSPLQVRRPAPLPARGKRCRYRRDRLRAPKAAAANPGSAPPRADLRCTSAARGAADARRNCGRRRSSRECTSTHPWSRRILTCLASRFMFT